MKCVDKLIPILNPRPKANYVSDADKFMAEFDSTHEKSPSQIKEIKKYREIKEQQVKK